MNSQLQDIMLRRGQLLEKIASQREQVAASTALWRAPLAAVDRGFLAVRYLRSRPLLLAGVAGLAALVVIRRWRIVTVAGGALRLWNFYKLSKDFSVRMASRL